MNEVPARQIPVKAHAAKGVSISRISLTYRNNLSKTLEFFKNYFSKKVDKTWVDVKFHGKSISEVLFFIAPL